MNEKQLLAVCEEYKLRIPEKVPIRVHGGLLHTMWWVDMSDSSYAIKQLSETVDLGNKSVVENYNLTERIASLFYSKGIPAVSALKRAALNDYLFIAGGSGFLVYPWKEAKTLKDEVSFTHVCKIATLIAEMHNINLQVPEIANQEFDIHPDEEILALIKRSKDTNIPFANKLEELQEDLLRSNQSYRQAIPILAQQNVISHGDLDQKNVLWDECREPLLIDWESARKVNPVYEIVNAALDWGGISNHFKKDLFTQMMDIYERAGRGVNQETFEAASWGVLGNWLHWLVYNINRSFSINCDQKSMGIQQVEQTLQTISRILIIMPSLTRR